MSFKIEEPKMAAESIFLKYTSLWEEVLDPPVLTGRNLIEFGRKLVVFRNSITCGVCNQLMTNREVLSPPSCEHFVCLGCRGGDREESRKCSRCEDWNVFEADDILPIILHSYQNFCYKVFSCEDVIRLLEVKHEVDPTFDAFKLLDFVEEALKGWKPTKYKRPETDPLANTAGLVPVPVGKKNKSKGGKNANKSISRESTTDVQKCELSAASNNASQKSNAPAPICVTPDKPQTQAVPLPFQEATPSSTIAQPSPSISLGQIQSQPGPLISQSQPCSSSSVSLFQSQTGPTVAVSMGPFQSQPGPSPILVNSQPQPVPSVSMGPFLPQPVPTSIFVHSQPQTGPSGSVGEPTRIIRTDLDQHALKRRLEDQQPVYIVPEINRETTPSQSPCSSNSGSPVKAVPTSAANTHLLLNSGNAKFVVIESPNKGGLSVGSKLPPTIRMVASSGINKNAITIPSNLLSSIRSSSGVPQILQITQSGPGGGPKTVHLGGSSIRLATNPQSRMPMPVQLISASTAGIQTPTTPVSIQNINTGPSISASGGGTPPTVSASASIANPSNASGAQKRRFVATTMTPLDIQRAPWGDMSKIIQLQAGDYGIFSRQTQAGGPRPNLVSVSVCRPQAAVNTGATGDHGSSPLVRPPTMATSTSTPQQPRQAQLISGSNLLNVCQTSGGVPILRAVPGSSLGTNSTGEQILIPTSSGTILAQGSSLANLVIGGVKKRVEGCKCGSGTNGSGNGKLTCIGQRCVCYADRNACSDCKCKGCKNPYVPGTGGKKVLHAVRTDSQAIPFLATPLGPPNSSAQGGVTLNNPNNNGAGGPNTFSTVPTGVPHMQQGQPLQIPLLRFGPPGATQLFQIAGNQAFPLLLQQSNAGVHQFNQGSGSTGFSIQGVPASSISGLQSAGISIAQLQQQQPQPRPNVNLTQVANEQMPPENKN